MSNYSKKDLDFFANKILENYDSKNPSIIFKEKINITNEEALIIQSNVARLREKRGEEIIGYKIGCVSKDTQKKDRKSTRLNSSHVRISYAVFCLKKKKHSR